MSKWKEYRFEVTILLPAQEARTVDLSFEDNSYRNAIQEAFDMVIHEEGLTEEDKQYLTIERI